MKIKYISALAALAALLLTQTISAAPLLEKITKPGFVLEERAINKSCVIQDTGNLAIDYNLGQLSSKRASVLKLNLATIKTIIDKAASGTLKTWPSIVDIGRVEYYAYQKQADGSLKKIILWQTGEIAPKTNNALEARLLRNFIDLNCGEPLLN
jgi:hypothetical protein